MQCSVIITYLVHSYTVIMLVSEQKNFVIIGDRVIPKKRKLSCIDSKFKHPLSPSVSLSSMPLVSSVSPHAPSVRLFLPLISARLMSFLISVRPFLFLPVH